MKTKLEHRRAERREAEREQQRRVILDAALRVFAERSFSEASVREVAAEAGFSVGHIYNLIGNKEALYDAMLARELAAMETAMAPVIASGAPGRGIERLDRLIDIALDFFHEHRLFFQIYLQETGGALAEVRSSLSPAGEKWKRRMKRRFLELVREAIADGDLVDLQPEDMIYVIEDTIMGFIARWEVSGRRGDLREKAPAIRHIIWKGIAASPSFRRRIP